MTSSLDSRNRAARWAALDRGTFDLCVIGGGVTGAGIARDAALRGLSVAMVEARDWASGTSSRSSKMIHGGLRYLAQGDVALVKEAASERQILRRIAPHLTQRMPFLIPITSAVKAAGLRTAMWTFEKLGGVPAEDRHEVLDAAALAAGVPALRRGRYSHAIRYIEFLTDDARLVLANVRAAQEAGATVLNYAEAAKLIVEDGRIAGIEARSTLPGDSGMARVRARQVVNAGGPWVDAVRALEGGEADTRLSLSRGIHLVLPLDRVPTTSTVILRTADKRSAFLVPRGRFAYVGTTDVFHDGADYWPAPARADVDYLLAALHAELDIAPVRDREIVALWSGVRPLVAQAGKSASEVSRKDELWTSPAGLISVAGGKLSAYRAMAERVTDLVVERLGTVARACETATRLLPGGEPTDAPHDADGERLHRLYGSEVDRVRGSANDIVAAEVRHAVAHEDAARLEDWWVRRAARAWFDDDAGLTALARAGDAMGAMLGWDNARTAAEQARCRELAADSRRVLKDIEE